MREPRVVWVEATPGDRALGSGYFRVDLGGFVYMVATKKVNAYEAAQMLADDDYRRLLIEDARRCADDAGREEEHGA